MVVGGIALCLLLNLGPQTGCPDLPRVDHYGMCGNREAVSISPTAWVIAPIALLDVFPAPRMSVIVQGTCMTYALSPPGLHRPLPPATQGWSQAAIKPTPKTTPATHPPADF
jgi:hypothetical protein